MEPRLSQVSEYLEAAAALQSRLAGACGLQVLAAADAVAGALAAARKVLLCGLTAVQGLLGLGNLLLGTHLQNTLHLVYGIFAVVFLPGLYFYSVSGRPSKAREAAYLAAACWIVLVAFVRGFMTGQ